jgi:cell division protein FtsI/penicillin-binding protein 2
MDAEGNPWVARIPAWNVWANPHALKVPAKEAAEELAPILKDEDAEKFDEYVRLVNLLGKDSNWVMLKQKVNEEVKNNVEALGLDGIGFDSIETSFYPEASAAAHVLGFVGKDDEGADVGYFGLEGYYNLPLSGKEGFFGGERDAKGSPILMGNTTEISAVSGVDLLTNINKRVQVIAERGLASGIEKYQAKGGSVTIMDPKTGKILAMASFPSFDPANYGRFNDSLFRNPVVTDTFEPGSILKVVVMASGLDAGVVKPDTPCDICSGPLKIDKYSIRTWNDKYTSDISMTDVIVESDNVGMSFVGQKLGADALYDYLYKFGFGQKTGIDLQGETGSALRKKGTWNSVDLATASFGQGIAVTGIQMVRAVAAIANGGYLVTPRVVDSVKGDGWSEPIKTDQPVKIISEKAAEETVQMMVEAANRGEAKWCKIPGYTVAGKTGTAQIAVEGHYDENDTNHSFIGLAPVKDPKFVMLVTLNSPQASPWAAETAAPTGYRIAKDLFPYFGIAPEK